MFGIRLSTVAVAGFSLGLAAPLAFADVLGADLNSLKASAPLSDVVKVHEGHGGMHKGCLKHKAPGAYPDCHWHEYVNGKYYVRRRPCSPKNLCDEN